LRTREFVGIAAAVVVSVAVSLFVAAGFVRHEVRREALKALARQAALYARTAAGEAARRRRAEQSRRVLRDAAGAAGNHHALPGEPAPPAERRRASPRRGAGRWIGRRQRQAVPVRGTAERRPRHRPPPVGRARGSDWRPFTLAFAGAAAVGAALAAVAAFLLAGALVRPIKRVADASRALAAGERHGPLPVEGPAEVAALAEAFNQMEEELDRAKDAERSFLLSVSHELKTPLASIRGHGEAMLDHVIDAPKAAGVVVQEAKRLERLVRDLLDLARLNQRAFTASPETVDLAALVDEAVARHEGDAARLGVGLVGESAEGAEATADPDRVLQVLSNLIENAIRSTPAGGTVAVTAAPGHLRVADTGPGLAADDLPRAFERFFLYSRYSTNRAVGTGLGLAIVKELTEAMGGSVTVESAAGVGTTFDVALPGAAVGRPAAVPQT
jgi:two-component system sensor histidine kinase BaeS